MLDTRADHRLGVTVEASLLSLIFVITIFILIGRNVQRYRKTLPKDDWKLLEVPADIFLFSIFICDFLQALGGLLNIRWVHDGIVKSGPIAQPRAPSYRVMLAVHTFVTALWSVDLQSRGFGFSLVGVICVFSALWVGVGNSIHRNYEEPTPFWCWISSAFEGERLAGEYIWLWITLFASVIMYIPLYFWAEGRLSVDRQRWYKFHLNNPDDRVGYTKRRAALGMLFYPLAYSLMVLPLSVARWSLGTRNTLPSLALFFGICTFSLSGVINVSMFWIIRRGRLLFIPPEETSKSEMELTPPCLPLNRLMSTKVCNLMG
ncbi:hypothetical protein BGW80DRAFT_1455405 [Lactifluus volemus]|nr:hypothetical protein BGW80DRAFT_1455405 [Lactifluus volemus]